MYPGDVVTTDAADGGGYGDPKERDVMDGCVTIEAARKEYGVVIDPDSKKTDCVATEELRRSKRDSEGIEDVG